MRNTTLRGLPVLGLCCALTAPGGPAAGDERRDARAEQAIHSTARVIASEEPRHGMYLTKGWGTGFLVDQRQKLLVTCAHVVNQTSTVRVTFPLYNGKQVIRDPKHYTRLDWPIRGWVVARDVARDVAVIEL